MFSVENIQLSTVVKTRLDMQGDKYYLGETYEIMEYESIF